MNNKRSEKENESTIRPEFALTLFGGISLLLWIWFFNELSESYLSSERWAAALSIACIASTLSFFALRGFIKNRKNALKDLSGGFCTYITIIMILLAFVLGYFFGMPYAFGPGLSAFLFSYCSPVFRWL